MTIGIDLRVLARGNRTGVEEYTLNLLAHLLGLDKSIRYKLFYNAYQKKALEYPWLNLSNAELYDFRIPNRFFFVSARYLNWPKIDRLLNPAPFRDYFIKNKQARKTLSISERCGVKGVDVYFSPHFFAAPVTKKCRKVITFHDLSFERHPQFFSWRKRAWQKFLMKARSEAKKADKIIAVSESTKKDLVNFYGLEPEKIEVIYSGVGEEFQNAKIKNQNDNSKVKIIKKKYHLPDKFILYFGTIEPRKNIIGLIKAFELLNTRYKIPRPTPHLNLGGGSKAGGQNTRYKLVIAGAKGWLYEDIFKTARQSKYRQDIIFTGFIEEGDKPFLYNLAELFVFPSFFEGFGFPPLEAMACGLPTIVSHSSSLPEVVGDSAIMIDPYNIDELAWAMEMALLDRDLRERLKEKGIEQAKKFSWPKCAEKTLRVLTE